MISEDLESLFGTIEVVTLPGPVGLTDAKGRELPCSGVITFGVELAGRTTSVTAWVSLALRNRIIVGSGIARLGVFHSQRNTQMDRF
jgi:hypothetical protein